MPHLHLEHLLFSVFAIQGLLYDNYTHSERHFSTLPVKTSTKIFTKWKTSTVSK